MTHEQRSAALVEIALGEVERLRDAKPSTPQDDDQAAHPITVDAATGMAHYGNDFLNPRGIRRIAQTLITWRAPCVVPGKSRRRASPSGDVQKR